MEQPEALLALADRIEYANGQPIAIAPQAAAELRRLHDDYENALKQFAEVVEGYKQMAAQRDTLLEALKLIDKEFKKDGRHHWPEAVKARAAIKAVEEGK